MKCERCNGEGWLALWGVDRTDVVCGECNGHGEVVLPFLPPGTPHEPSDG